MGKQGFKLPGTLDVKVKTTTVDKTLDGETINFAKKEVDRVSGPATSFTATYYIMAKANINDSITYHPSSTTAGQDDGYSMKQILLTEETNPNATFYLPTASLSGTNAIKAGTINLTDTDGLSAGFVGGTFDVGMAISINDQGTFDNVSVSITGTTRSDVIPDDPNKAQVAYWATTDLTAAASISQDAADILQAELLGGDVHTHFASQRATIAALYNGVNQINSWTMTFNTVSVSNSEPLAQHAANNGTRGLKNIFKKEDKIVTKEPMKYIVKFKDVNDDEQTLVSETFVYGVVEQS